MKKNSKNTLILDGLKAPVPGLYCKVVFDGLFLALVYRNASRGWGCPSVAVGAPHRGCLLGQLPVEPVGEALDQRVPPRDDDTAVQALRRQAGSLSLRPPPVALFPLPPRTEPQHKVTVFHCEIIWAVPSVAPFTSRAKSANKQSWLRCHHLTGRNADTPVLTCAWVI